MLTVLSNPRNAEVGLRAGYNALGSIQPKHMNLYRTAAVLLSVGLGAFASADSIREMKELDGIPMHYVSIPPSEQGQVEIRLDGVVNEPAWQTVAPYDEMLVSMPGTGEKGTLGTEIRMLPTERGLYVSAEMEQPRDSLIRRLTNRDEFIDLVVDRQAGGVLRR